MRVSCLLHEVGSSERAEKGLLAGRFSAVGNEGVREKVGQVRVRF